jgi:hypothetical protein
MGEPPQTDPKLAGMEAHGNQYHVNIPEISSGWSKHVY